jgi:hypothetical protein
MTRYPKLKRALRKLELSEKGGHWHPSYVECDKVCQKNASKLKAERERLDDGVAAINRSLEAIYNAPS